MERELEEAARRLTKARRLLIGTGAGMSADSSVPTYRAPGESPWQRYGRFEALGFSAEDLSCPGAFEEDPQHAWGFLEWKRRLIATHEPHAGYAALHRLAAKVPKAFIQTTNVDGYHLRAGWPREDLHEVHGSLWRLQCLGPCSPQVWEEPRAPLAELDRETMRASEWPRCPSCNRTARPHALLFADLEYLGDRKAEERRRRFHASRPDVMLVVGESGVIPTHTHDARRLRTGHQTFVIEINPDPDAGEWADIHLPERAQQVLVALEQAVNDLAD